jgi:hypothetical protein
MAADIAVKAAIEKQTAVSEAILAELRRLNEQIAWQNNVLASQAAQRAGH